MPMSESSDRYPSRRVGSGAAWQAAQPWLAWWAILAMATIAMHAVRGDLNEGHAALAYLLIVLGGSVSGGRALGFTLSGAGVLLIDYFFQPPFDTWSVDKPLDWVVLVAFLIVAGVATQLLARAQRAAQRAEQRADEVAWLSRLGADALNAGRAADALAAIAAVVRRTLDATECTIHGWSESGVGAQPLARDGDPGPDPEPPALELAAWAGTHGRAAGVRRDGAVVHEARGAGGEALGIDAGDLRFVALPLQVNGRTVGVLTVAAGEPIARGEARRRFLDALAYYAALGIERLRLESEAEHAAALREADRLKDFVLASVSHDLRTPLTAIKALAHEAAGRGEENARIIEEQADRLGRLVSDLLDLSRMKAGAFPVRCELNAAEDLLGALVRHVGRALDGRLRPMPVDLARPALLGRFDFVQSMRILANLVENAHRYAPPGTVIELDVTRSADTLQFSVSDRGPGVPASEEERIFDPFYRPEGALPGARAAGAGLGLAIARGLAEAQGGALRYTPRPGGGSVFTLALPAWDGPVAESTMAADR